MCFYFSEGVNSPFFVILNIYYYKLDIMNVYTMENWRNDGSLKLSVGQFIDEEVFEQLLDSVPPQTYGRGIFQPGEAYDANANTGKPLYMTFVKEDLWKYVGLCAENSTKDETEFSYGNYHKNDSVNEEKILVKLTESELYDIVEESVRKVLKEIL